MVFLVTSHLGSPSSIFSTFRLPPHCLVWLAFPSSSSLPSFHFSLQPLFLILDSPLLPHFLALFFTLDSPLFPPCGQPSFDCSLPFFFTVLQPPFLHFGKPYHALVFLPFCSFLLLFFPSFWALFNLVCGLFVHFLFAVLFFIFYDSHLFSLSLSRFLKFLSSFSFIVGCPFFPLLWF